MEWTEFTESNKDWMLLLASKFGLEQMKKIRNSHVWRSESNIKVFYSEDNTPKWGWLKHLSISKKDRYPTWDEIVMVKEKFLGDIDVAMILPKKEDYINLHENCFHLWQIPGGWGLR